MTTRNVFLLLLFASLGFPLRAAVSDDFNDGTLNPTLWGKTLPFIASQVVESNGYVTLVNRGGLVSLNSYARTVEIKGWFRFLTQGDTFKVVIRSDLSEAGGEDARYHEKLGITFVFWETGRSVAVASSDGVTFGLSEEVLNSIGVGNQFRITDDGQQIRLFLNNSVSPTISGTTTYRRGDRIIFYNRETLGFPYRTEIDQLEISSSIPMESVPKPIPQAKFAGHYIGVASPAKFTSSCDGRAVVSLVVSPDGSFWLYTYTYDLDLVLQGEGTIDSKGKFQITVDGNVLSGKLSASGTVRLSGTFNGCRYTATAYRRFRAAATSPPTRPAL